jgi:hypothetical protein
VNSRPSLTVTKLFTHNKPKAKGTVFIFQLLFLFLDNKLEDIKILERTAGTCRVQRALDIFMHKISIYFFPKYSNFPTIFKSSVTNPYVVVLSALFSPDTKIYPVFSRLTSTQNSLPATNTTHAI